MRYVTRRRQDAPLGLMLTTHYQYQQWQAITTLDILLELMIVSLSILLVWNLQTSFPRKATVVAAFALRLMYVRSPAERPPSKLTVDQHHCPRCPPSQIILGA